jgi:hypothetical protein
MPSQKDNKIVKMFVKQPQMTSLPIIKKVNDSAKMTAFNFQASSSLDIGYQTMANMTNNINNNNNPSVSSSTSTFSSSSLSFSTTSTSLFSMNENALQSSSSSHNNKNNNNNNNTEHKCNSTKIDHITSSTPMFTAPVLIAKDGANGIGIHMSTKALFNSNHQLSSNSNNNNNNDNRSLFDFRPLDSEFEFQFMSANVSNNHHKLKQKNNKTTLKFARTSTGIDDLLKTNINKETTNHVETEKTTFNEILKHHKFSDKTNKPDLRTAKTGNEKGTIYHCCINDISKTKSKSNIADIEIEISAVLAEDEENTNSSCYKISKN